MAGEPRQDLPPELVEFLQVPRIVVVTTTDHETGTPMVNVISWVLARDARTLRVAGDGRARFVQNMRAGGRVALLVLGAGTAWTIYGTAGVLAEALPGVPLRLTLVELTDLTVFDSLFFGARLTAHPDWEVTYDAARAAELDRKVYAAMRSPAPNPR